MSIVEPSILVPVDSSVLAEAALPQAIRLAKALQRPIQLFTIVDNVVANAVTEFAEERGIGIYECVDAYFERLLNEVRAGGVEAEFHFEPDLNPADGILGFIERRDVDMVVMASHGYSGLTRWLLGSITEKVVRGSNIPVVVVPVRER